MCINCRNKKDKYPPRILQALEKKGFFDMTPEEIFKKSRECLEQLYRSSKIDFESGREAFNELRGGYE